MAIGDPAVRDALAKYRNRNRVFNASALWVGATLSWGVAAIAGISVIADPAVAADLDSGTHTRNVDGAGWAAVVCALLGSAFLIATVWRGPSLARWIGVLVLLLGGVPLLWLSCLAFLLSR